jgi:hypothetical protein
MRGGFGGPGGLGDLLAGDPLGSTLAAAPVVVLLFALLARQARARGADLLPAGWTRFALAALAALGVAALARGPLCLDGATPAIAAGFLGLAAVHSALQTRALRPLLGDRVPARPSLLFFALPAVLYAALLPWAAERRQPDGDEPYYLLVAHSLAFDLDADLANQYAAGDWRYFMDRPIGPQPGDPRGADGEVYSRHNALLPLALALPYRLAGKAGVLLAMGLIAAALAWLTLRLAGRYFPGHPGEALATYALLALAPPLLCYAQQVWVEVPAAALLVAALAALPRRTGETGDPSDRGRRAWPGWLAWLGLALPLALLPLLKIRFALVALPVLFLAFRGSGSGDSSGRPGRSKRSLLLVAGALAAVLAAVLAWNQLRYGNPLKIHRWDELALPAVSARQGVEGLFGLFWDAAFGLFAFAPLWLLVVPALLLAIRRRIVAAGHLALVAIPYLLLLAPREEWYGGWSPPFRYGVVLLPLLAVVLVPLLAERHRPGARLVLAALGAATVALALVWLAVPGLTYHLADGRTRLLDALSAGLGADAARLFPSYVRTRLASWLWPPVAAALVTGLWWLGRPSAQRPTAGWGRAAGVGVALFVAAVAALPALATRLPTRVVEAEDPWVIHHGGHVHPETWVISRGRFQGGWVIRPGESIEVPLVRPERPDGSPDRVRLRAALRVGRNNPDPFRLEVLSGGEKLAGWVAGGGGIWGLVDLGTFELPDGETLVIRAAGPPRAGEQNGALIDRLELTWP